MKIARRSIGCRVERVCVCVCELGVWPGGGTTTRGWAGELRGRASVLLFVSFTDQPAPCTTSDRHAAFHSVLDSGGTALPSLSTLGMDVSQLHLRLHSTLQFRYQITGRPCRVCFDMPMCFAQRVISTPAAGSPECSVDDFSSQPSRATQSDEMQLDAVVATRPAACRRRKRKHHCCASLRRGLDSRKSPEDGEADGSGGSLQWRRQGRHQMTLETSGNRLSFHACPVGPFH